MTTSEQFGNWRAGRGFKSDATLNKSQQANSALNTTPQKSSGKNSILDDPNVKKDLNQAWIESKDGQASVTEQGGWIVDDGKGSQSVVRWPQGKSGSIAVPGSRPTGTVAEFHTHPYSLSETFFPGPSGSGANFSGDFYGFNDPSNSVYGLRHFIIDRQGIIEYYDNGSWQYIKPPIK